MVVATILLDVTLTVVSLRLLVLMLLLCYHDSSANDAIPEPCNPSGSRDGRRQETRPDRDSSTRPAAALGSGRVQELISL